MYGKSPGVLAGVPFFDAVFEERFQDGQDAFIRLLSVDLTKFGIRMPPSSWRSCPYCERRLPYSEVTGWAPPPSWTSTLLELRRWKSMRSL